MKSSYKKKNILRATQQTTAKPYFLQKEQDFCRTGQKPACLNLQQGNSECVCQLVAVHKLFATSSWQVSTEIESNHFKTLIKIWRSNFISLDSNKKKLGVWILYVCFLFHFSSYSMLLYSTKLSIYKGLEIFFKALHHRYLKSTDLWEDSSLIETITLS